MTRPTDHPTDVLLAQGKWLRRLARSLLDEAAAEDVVQETLAAALASPPKAGRPLGPWLTNVLRNFARMNLRGDRRRRAREQSLAEAPSDPLPTPEELLAHHQAQRMVAEAVEGLDEPFRSTILLCYGEGLAPSEIARRLGILPGTVRWRLKRALELTRERLDQSRQGNRRKWALLLGPLAQRGAEQRGVALLLAKGVVLMKAKVAIAAALLLVVVVLLSLVGWTYLRPSHLARGPANAETEPADVTPRGRAAPIVPQLAPAWSPSPVADEANGTIEGTVRDERGQPIAGAQVAAVPSVPLSDLGAGHRSLGPAATGTTDAAGVFRLAGLTAAGHGVTATAPGFEPGHRGLVTPRKEPSQGRVDLVLARGGVTQRGRILDVGGGPVASARVMALSLAGAGSDATQIFVAIADARGRYELNLHRRGRYGFAADADGYAQTRLGAESIDQDGTKDIVLKPAAQVSGSVVDARTRVPVSGAMVRLARQDGSAIPFVVSALSDAGGSFKLRGVLPATYRLWARLGSAAGRHPTPVIVREAEFASGIVIALDSRPAISGHVKSASGKAIPGAELWFLKEEETIAQERQAVAGPDGSYRIEGILPAVYALRASAPGFSPETRPVAVAAADLQDADFTLSPEARILGKVMTAAGEAAGSVRIVALSESPGGAARNFHTTRTLPDGTFRIEGLKPGQVRIGAEDATFGLARAAVWTVSAGDTKEVALQLEPGARLSGQVRFSDGRPAASVVVTAYQGVRGLGMMRSTLADADGAFVLTALANGQTRVFASRQEMLSEPEDVPAGAVRAIATMAGGQDAKAVDLVLPVE